jgi:hypothetical protein
VAAKQLAEQIPRQADEGRNVENFRKNHQRNCDRLRESLLVHSLQKRRKGLVPARAVDIRFFSKQHQRVLSTFDKRGVRRKAEAAVEASCLG